MLRALLMTTQTGTVELPEEEYQRLVAAEKISEFHAFGVRQAIAYRERVHRLISLVGSLAEFSVPGTSPGRLRQVLSLVDQTPSQFLQDIFCLLLNGGKEGGFFVEFGSCDGHLLSNTLCLEQQFGWNGILAEPSRTWLPKIRANRSCTIEDRCVWSVSGAEIEFAEFSNDEYDTRSGVLTVSDEDLHVAETYKVETVSLTDMLDQHQAPAEIDFMSVDTEGSELEILKAFDFQKYRIAFLAVEHKTLWAEEPIKALLDERGYKQILRSVSGHDGFYVPDSSPAAQF